MFRSVDPKEDFVALEHKIIEFWHENGIFAKRIRLNEGNPRWSFIDGPITANNPMGVHHAWGRTYKDVYQRYMGMRGFEQRYQNGYDCQGLWLEVETEKDLGFNSKRDIENYGLDNFSRQCRARVERFSGIQTKQSIRLGQWMRWDDSYYTMTDTNIEYIWHFLRLCHQKGWLYAGRRAMPWCTRCGTSLSQHELADGYMEIDDTSIYVRFPLKERDSESLLVWTTTPWTLTSNVAAAVNPDLTYARVAYEGRIYYVSEGTREKIFKDKGQPLGTLSGAEMVGWTYDGPFDDLPMMAGMEHQVVPWAEVGEEEGTGIVHIAPGCGAEDNELGQEIGLAIVVPLDGNGVYVDGFGWLSGRDVHEVEKPILEDLQKKGIFFRLEAYRHRYPHCWRCREKLVFRVEKEWFIGCDEIRPLMKAEAAKVRWIPESVGKRCQDWYNNMGDWCISRKRYWGLPLPFYFCGENHLTIVGSRKELRERAIAPEKVDSLPELHRPWIDEVRIRCAECGAEATRILDVGDCWLDAGIVAFSTLKYHEDRAYWEKWFPAELVCEMREQVRLWFYSMMFMSVTLEGRAPYRRVFSYEKVHDEQNRPMHRSHGNAVWFDDVVEQMGADVMRWLYCAWNPSYNLRFGVHIADDVRRRLLTLWNVYGFFCTYAKLDQFDPGTARIEETLGESPNPLDRWVLSALNGTVGRFREQLDNYDVGGAIRTAERFLEGLSTWYVRRSRRRFWRGEADEDKRFAYRTLYHVLATTARLLAPVIPFVTEEIWRNLTGPQRERGSDGVPESVHLADYPEENTRLIDRTLNQRVDEVLRIVSLGRAAREKVQIKVRQPLATLWVIPLAGRLTDLGASLLRDIAEELNVKEVCTDRAATEVGEAAVKLNFPVLGKRIGSALKEVQVALKHGNWERLPGGRLRVADWEIDAAEFDLVYEPQPGVALAHDQGLMVALDTTVTEELLLEGYARELIRRVQELRKQADYQVDDRIILRWDGDHSVVEKVLERHGAVIGAETLAKEIARGKGPVDRDSAVVLGKNRSIWIGVHR